MIDSLKIKNVQSHKDSELKFSDGVNAIVGTSNNGKSAILRALIWAITNRPLGVDILCSDWALDKKGNQISPMEVEVEKNGHVLIRYKSKSKNQYLLDDEELNAIGTDVPPEVKKFFSLSETNIQKQQDKPFLVSESSSDVAKYFNSMMNLNVIDNILKKTEAKKREIRNNKINCENTLKTLNDEFDGLSWVDNAENYLEKIEKLESKKSKKQSLINEFETSMNEHERMIELKNSLNVKKATKYISKLNACEVEIKENTSIFDGLNGQISEWEENKNINEQLEKTKKANKIISLLKKYDSEIKNNEVEVIENSLLVIAENKKIKLTSEICKKAKKIISELKVINKNDDEEKVLRESIINYEENKNEIVECKKEIKENESLLPDVCPTCGQPWNKCKEKINERWSVKRMYK